MEIEFHLSSDEDGVVEQSLPFVCEYRYMSLPGVGTRGSSRRKEKKNKKKKKKKSNMNNNADSSKEQFLKFTTEKPWKGKGGIRQQ